MWEKVYKIDNSRSKEILGIKYYEISDTLVSMAEALINNGVLPDNRSK